MKCRMDPETFQALFHYRLRSLSPYLWCGARASYHMEYISITGLEKYIV